MAAKVQFEAFGVGHIIIVILSGNRVMDESLLGEPASESLGPLACRAIRDQGNDYRRTGSPAKIVNEDI